MVTFSWFSNICGIFISVILGIDCFFNRKAEVSLHSLYRITQNFPATVFVGRIRFRIPIFRFKNGCYIWMGALGYFFSFSYIIVKMTVFIWFTALRYLIRPSEILRNYNLQLVDASLAATFSKQIFTRERWMLMTLFRQLTAGNYPWNQIWWCCFHSN